MKLRIAFGALVVFLFATAALVSLFWTPFDYRAIDVSQRLRAPGGAHMLGTDHMGRDLLSMVMVGARYALLSALSAVMVGMVVGVPLGLWAAVTERRWLSELLNRTNDLIFAFPPIILAIMAAATLGPSQLNAIFAIGVFNIPVFARITRAGAVQLWRRDFVLAARLFGKSNYRISIEHVLPGVLGLLIVQGTTQLAMAVFADSALAYIGLGAQPPMPSWGRMLGEAQTMFLFAPHMAFVPGCAIVLLVLALNSFGDGLRDMLDPKLRRSIS